MASFMNKARAELATDQNINHFTLSVQRGAKALPRSSVQYVLDKVPVIQWLPKYYWKWLLNDLVAGLTVGVMLLPQALAYAKIATIPVEIGLMSSWLPALLYTIMGTSKDLSTGPTSILGLLTAEIVKEMAEEGYKPQIVAPAIAFMVGIYGMLVGFFNLGFLLEYISTPVLSGFISAAAIVIMLGQIPSLFGLTHVRSGTANILHDFFTTLGESQWRTVLIGFSCIFILQSLQWAGKKYGKKSNVVWALSTARAALVLLIFTTISYAVNNSRVKKPLFEISKIRSAGISPPILPAYKLISKVAVKSVAPFLAASLENTGILKAFALKNDYRIDASQELSYLGVVNLLNSMFGAMPVGAAMSRTAVNSDAGVKSPLSGLFTSIVVLLGIYKMSGALYWIPKATLAAIIITAVIHLVGPLSKFYRYWRTSFADFVASMLCFWATLFLSAEQGIAFGVAFSIIWTMLRAAFSGVTNVSTDSIIEEGKTMTLSYDEKRSHAPTKIEEDTKVFRFDDSILFPNAERVKEQILDVLQVEHSGAAHELSLSDRKNQSWSVARESRVQRLRKRAQIGPHPPHLRIVVLDFAKVSMIDSTALDSFSALRKEIARFAGEQCEIRCVNVDNAVWNRFERYGWVVKTALDHSRAFSLTNGAAPKPDIIVYDYLKLAVETRPHHKWSEETEMVTVGKI